MEDTYIFMRDKDTRQVHIYRARLELDGTVRPYMYSECGARKSRNAKPDSVEYDEDGHIMIYDENSARRRCPKYGRPLCGRCVSTLYTDYDEE